MCPEEFPEAAAMQPAGKASLRGAQPEKALHIQISLSRIISRGGCLLAAEKKRWMILPGNSKDISSKLMSSISPDLQIFSDVCGLAGRGRNPDMVSSLFGISCSYGLIMLLSAMQCTKCQITIKKAQDPSIFAFFPHMAAAAHLLQCFAQRRK